MLDKIYHAVISIHALREEGDQGAVDIAQATPISIHALREEGDFSHAGQNLPRSNFYPRPPRGGRPFDTIDANIKRMISIHALREEGDRAVLSRSELRMNFYPRPPRGGRRGKHIPCALAGGFLSTPSARRATARYRCAFSA